MALFFAALLVLHAAFMALGALSTLLHPRRAALQYGAATDPTVVLFMAPLQGAMALVMLNAAYALVTDASAQPRISVVLAAVSLMELGFVGIRLRANALRGASPAWRFASRSGVVSLRGSVMSGVFSLLYAGGALGFWLGGR